MTRLTIENLTVAIRDTVLLDNINIEILPGKVTALVGHNGAGKSTLMKTILGWQDKKAGEVFINGISQEKDFLLFKQQLSYIPEEPLLISELTTMQHFQLYAKSYQLDQQAFLEKAKYYTNALEIDDKLDEYPESLSKGMRQKVQMICSLLPDVPLLLIDEPFMGLDIYASELLEKIIAEKASNGTTILITTHQLERLANLADDYIMLQQGKITEQGSISEFRQLKRRFD
ncbi:ABC transporter ATP-binding protein [Radiobacillus sp. PE A8.2]|uniref:ABC transporter ATP-binding protein n=1 Tax=Radiobacillus sp. PE A8.2 TaxID=3380349 RepID=UPI00388FC68A